MALSRRSFVKAVGIGAGGALSSSFISARGREAWRWGEDPPSADSSEILLSSNENPLGPGDVVLDAIRKGLGPNGALPGRYPGDYYKDPIAEALAGKFGVKPENVLVGAGSTQILVTATQVYTSKDSPLVGSLPTYEECTDYAALIGSRVKSVPLDSRYKMDLGRTLHAAKGAGMLFFCNPNNPVATMVGSSDSKEFLSRMLKYSPETHILVDEAYIDYVDDDARQTMIPLAMEDPRVVVARTFSKAYGMAGLRVGYAIAHVDTIKELAAWHMGNSISGLSFAAAIAAIEQDSSFIEKERARNAKVREYTTNFFTQAGHMVTDSQTNFLFVDVGMPIEEFREACKKRGIRVGRPFPPLWTHCRISLGTMQEMQRATRVFAEVLGAKRKSAA
ncbi:MAG: aminotransferase class I/II-fold pyridoxal phosphate-dependent enzyme [Acidobacteriota bacterium]